MPAVSQNTYRLRTRKVAHAGRIHHLVLTLSLGLTLSAALQVALRKLDPGRD